MTQAQTAGIEYSVYTFDKPLPRQKGDNSWKRHFAGTDCDLALEEARLLSKSRQFHRVEVKKKFYDTRQNRIIDKTFKVFPGRSLRERSRLMAALLLRKIILR